MASTPTMLQATRTPYGSQGQGPQFYERLMNGDPEAEKRVRDYLSRVRMASNDGRATLESGWWQKLLYVNGRQWIYPTRRGWADKRMQKWIPRPVTNETKLAAQTIRAIVTRSVPTLRVMPSGSDSKHVITAEMAQSLEPVISEEHRKPQRWYEADFWAPVLGTSFFHPYWDRDNTARSEFIQGQMCPECGFVADPMMIERGEIQGCPDCGVEVDDFQPAEDENGEIGEEVSMGIGATDVVSALEMMIPTYYQRWDDVGELIRYRWRPKSWYEGREYAEKLNFSGTGGSGLQMFKSLALMTDLSTTYPGSDGSGSTQGCVESELWIKPCEEFPDGLWCRAAGGPQGEMVIIRDEDRGIVPGPLPYTDKFGKALWNWTYLPYEEIGGRIWAASALDGVIPLQDKLNRNDSMIELAMQRMSNPVWTEPKGAEVQRFTGEPGLVVRYNVMAGSQAKPERLDGLNPPSAAFALREQYIDDIRRITGTRDVLQGIQPGGVDSFSGLNLLLEQSQGMFTPYLKARGRCQKDNYLLQLELERHYGPRERIKPILGGENTWTFQMFDKARLSGAFSIYVEDGSEQPKTSLGMRAALSTGKEFGVVPFEDPSTAAAVLQVLGISSLVPSLDQHTKAAKIEQEQYIRWVKAGRPGSYEQCPLRVMATQNHGIHVQQHDLWANNDEIRQLMFADKECEMEITTHRVEHLIAQQNPFGIPVPMQAQAAMGELGVGAAGVPPGAAAGPGPQPAEGAGRAMLNSQQESNAPDTLPGAAPGGGNMAEPV